MTKPSRKRMLAAAAFVIVTSAILVLAIALFTSLRVFKPRDRYFITYDQSVYGLDPGALVYFNGIKMGRVEHLRPDPTNLNRVEVTIAIARNTPVRADTHAELRLAGLTGSKIIDLRGGNVKAARLEPGSSIPTRETGFDRLEKQVSRLVDDTETLIASVRRLVERYDAVGEGLNKTTATIAEMVTENRAALHSSIVAATQAAQSTSHLLDTQVAQLLQSTHLLVGDLGRIVRGGGEQLRSALGDIRQASRNFKDFSREIRQKPSRLLFSGAAPDRKVR